MCHSAQFSSLVYYVLAFLFYNKQFGIGLRLLGCYIMLMSHQNFTFQKTWTFSNPTVRNSNLTKLSTVQTQDSDCLMLVCIWNALPSCIGSQDSMIGTATHYRLGSLETESQKFLQVIYVSITKHYWTNTYFVWFQASVAKMIVQNCAVLTQYVLSP